jgi:aldose 1-epimerase
MARTWATGEQHHLTFQDQEAWVTEVGATLRAYRDATGDMVDGLRADEPISAGRGQTLMPWPNRIRDGRYTFAGKSQQLSITEVPKSNSSHGLLRWANWKLVDKSSTSVTLGCTSYPQPGYPFAFDAEITYSLSSDGLSVRMAATNCCETDLPFGMGSHPYFTTGTETVDDNVLICPALSYLDADEQSIPVGELAVDDATDFRSPRSLNDAALNLCYSKLIRNDDGHACFDVLRSGTKEGIRVWMDEAFDYAMVYTAEDLPVDRRRKSVAIEPMTCAPDAFNNRMGLLVLEPGESVAGNWGVRRLQAG